MMDIDQLMWDSGMTEWFNADLASFTALKSAAGKIAALVAAAERKKIEEIFDDIFHPLHLDRETMDACSEFRTAIRALP